MAWRVFYVVAPVLTVAVASRFFVAAGSASWIIQQPQGHQVRFCGSGDPTRAPLSLRCLPLESAMLGISTLLWKRVSAVAALLGVAPLPSIAETDCSSPDPYSMALQDVGVAARD